MVALLRHLHWKLHRAVFAEAPWHRRRNGSAQIRMVVRRLYAVPCRHRWHGSRARQPIYAIPRNVSGRSFKRQLLQTEPLPSTRSNEPAPTLYPAEKRKHYLRRKIPRKKTSDKRI